MRWLQRPAAWALGGAVFVLVAVSWRQWLAIEALPDGLPIVPPPIASAPSAPAIAKIDSGFDPFAKVETSVVSSLPPATRRRPHDVILEGVLHLPGQGGGAAILRHKDEVEAFRVGARIDGRVELVEIHADHVILSNEGRREVLNLRRPAIADARPASKRQQRRFARNHQQELDFD